MDTRIYVMQQRQPEMVTDDIYTFFQPESFMAGMAWLWKNVSCDIIGINYDDRFFAMNRKNPEILRKEYIESILRNYDCIVEEGRFLENVNVRKQYEEQYRANDIEVCENVLETIRPEYVEAFDFCLNSYMDSEGSMLIMRKDNYDQYCMWLLPILEEIERRTSDTDREKYSDDICLSLAPLLLRTWVLKQGVRAREEYGYHVIPDEENGAIQKINLIKRYVKGVLKPLLDSYKAGKPYDLVDVSPIKQMGDKIPVWVCWWQGVEQAPELVQMCIKSIQKYLPAEKAELHIITMSNLGEYITLPDWVIRKFGQGKITMTFLSDILRFSLLYRYGGLWMDATYCVTKNIFDDIFNSYDFYTQRLERSEWRLDVPQGRWACNFIYGEKGDLFFRFMLNGLFRYWQVEDEIIDYYLTDYMIDLAYEEFSEIRKKIQKVPVNNRMVLHMQQILNDRYVENTFQELCKDTSIFKLSYKSRSDRATLIQEPTFYQKLCEEVEM